MSEEHPLDALRRLATLAADVGDLPPSEPVAPALAYAVAEIARLTEALAAARSEAADNAEDRDGYARSINTTARETAGLCEAACSCAAGAR